MRFRLRRSTASRPRLRSAAVVVERWRADGGTPAAALRHTLAQVQGARALIEDEAGWSALRRLRALAAGDSWLAADWPEGFDPLLLCAPLCRLVEYECARCRVGQTQQGRSCAHPDSAFGRAGGLLDAGDREGLQRHLDAQAQALRRMLDAAENDTET